MKIHKIKCGIVKCYLLAGEGGMTLIDTGTKKYRRRVLKRVRRIVARTGKPLKLIILTHAHNDHSDNAAFLSGELNVPVAMSAADNAIIGGDMIGRIKTHGFMGHIVFFFTRLLFGGKKVDGFTPALLLYGGEKLSADDYGADMEIILLPGHSPGSIGIIAGDIFFAGDTFPAVRKYFSHAIYEDLEALKESGKRIRALPVKKIYLGHGPDLRKR